MLEWILDRLCGPSLREVTPAMAAGLFILLSLALIVLPAASNAASFQRIGALPLRESEASGVSADGSVVAGSAPGVGVTGDEAFRWTSAGGMVGLGHLPGDNASDGYAVSGDGSTVVGASYTSATSQQAFRWTSTGGMVGLGVLPGTGAFSEAEGVSGDGSVVVGFSLSSSGGYRAFRWTSAGGMVDLGFLPSGDGSSEAWGASADGSVVAGSSGGNAFRWTAAGGMVALPSLVPGGGTSAYGMSPNGSVIVGYAGSSIGAQAFRWTSPGGTIGLGILPGDNGSRALGVSADGSVVVGDSSFLADNRFDIQGFIWDAKHGMRPVQQVLTNDYGLDLEGLIQLTAVGVSADGDTIVGTGIDRDTGYGEGWIATIPEPGTGLLVMAGLLGLAAQRRRA